MTKYEARKLLDEEKVKTITIGNITITITIYASGVLGIETSATLTANQENTLKTELTNRGYKLIWKEGVVLP